MIKLPKIVIAVLGLHLGVIGLLMFQPGCQSTRHSGIPSEPTTSSEAQVMDTVIEDANVVNFAVTPAYEENNAIDSAFNAGFETETARSTGSWSRSNQSTRTTPTRPNWEMNEVPVDTLVSSEPLTVLEPTNPVVTTSNFEKEETGAPYTIQRGDSLWKIAKKHGVSLQALLNANGLSKQSVIHPGKTLLIPGGTGATSTTSFSSDTTRPSYSGEDLDIYVVMPGDSLSKIARRFGTTVNDLQRINGISGTRIYAGQELRLKKGAFSTTSVSPKTSIRSTQQVALEGGMTHVVERGDTLGYIAKRYNVSVNGIMNLNGIKDPRKLRVGQKLLLSAKAKVDELSSVKPSSRDEASVVIGSGLDKEDILTFDDFDEDIPTVPVESSDANE